MNERPVIFHYLDFREFCADMFVYLKSKRASYSHRNFAQRAGLKAPNAFKRVVDGSYGLPPKTALKFAKGLGLTSNETTYFVHLCAANQAADTKVRARHERKMVLSRKRHEQASDETDGYEYLKSWYLVAIRELLQMPEAPQTAAAIAKALYPTITEKQAKDGLEVLLRLGLVTKTKAGLRATSDAYVTPSQVSSMAVRQFNYQSLSLALDAMDELPLEERQYGTLTLAVSSSQKQKILARLREVQQQILNELHESDEPSTEVMHVGFYAIPFTNNRMTSDE